MNNRKKPISEKKDADLLIDRAIQGDLEAFSFLYKENVQKIYNYIFYRIGNVYDAEDLTARVFQRALKHIPNYKKKGVPFSAWLYRIAHNLVANWHRDNSRKKEVPINENIRRFYSGEQPEPALLQTQEMEELLVVIRNISSDRQLLIVLKYVEKLTNAEIARIMGRSEGAVKSLYHRTLLELKRKLTQD
ncbi:MAG TPA: sigma-70 family RNA polymerase sigma factor [Anaerolineae bacterium]|nr:sigma-70 family RNA polymerase sigma factor [Anaerolineae bacterium]